MQDITSEDTLVHRDKDMSRFAAELAAEDADIDDVEDVGIDELDEVEDLDDFEYTND